MSDDTASQYLWHVTLSTGDVRKSFRSEVDDRVIVALRPLIEADGERPIIQIPGRTLRVTRSAGMLLATVMAAVSPICTIGVAARSSGGAKLWDMLHQGIDAQTHRAEPPHAPWCAARIEPGIMAHQTDLHWLGDFERCLAWAWIASAGA